MIYLTRLSHAPILVNSDLIQHVEVTPDTVISLTSGEKILVLESSDEVVARVIAFRRSIFENLPLFVAANSIEFQKLPCPDQTENRILPRS